MASSKRPLALAALVAGALTIAAACVAELGTPEDEIGFLAEALSVSCVESDDRAWTETVTLSCASASIPTLDTQCRYHFNTVVSTGAGDRYLLVSPAFVNVPEGPGSVSVTLTLAPGGSSGKLVTIQRTLQNCRSGMCSPFSIGTVNVVRAGSGLCDGGGGASGCAFLRGEERCNEIDDDCDGDIDEGVVGTICGDSTGECSAGFTKCEEGEWVCRNSVGPRSETCDNRDNDCDGDVDEGVTRGCGATDVGTCAFGRETCSSGVFGGCTAVVPRSELCDRADNDCDGVTDEDLVDPTIYRTDLHCGACNIHCSVEENCVDAECELDPGYPHCPPDLPECSPF